MNSIKKFCLCNWLVIIPALKATISIVGVLVVICIGVFACFFGGIIGLVLFILAVQVVLVWLTLYEYFRR